MIERGVVVGAVLVLAFVAVAAWERRRGRVRSGLPSGLIIATSEACALCDAAIGAISAAGPDLSVRVVDVTAFEHLRIRSVPTVILADRRGEIVMRRTGRSAITDAEAIVRAARALV